jgi:hypothetical protein
MEGVYAHLLTEAEANKILNGLTPKEKELVRTRMANIKEHRHQKVHSLVYSSLVSWDSGVFMIGKSFCTLGSRFNRF